ncbi:hypothetical protein AB833_17410 [Chromatiales bacterium (ex Bugula neritina AB1)]|nr:hypothetical protein AB833_17410 [Chromatiales bacterium (ex Bugula neritina AB1)]
MTETAKPATEENLLSMRREDFEALLDRAAQRGAERCLAQLGLEQAHAERDLRELRDLLHAWRDVRRTARQTLVRVATAGLLAALVLGAAIKFKGLGA